MTRHCQYINSVCVDNNDQLGSYRQTLSTLAPVFAQHRWLGYLGGIDIPGNAGVPRGCMGWCTGWTREPIGWTALDTDGGA